MLDARQGRDAGATAQGCSGVQSCSGARGGRGGIRTGHLACNTSLTAQCFPLSAHPSPLLPPPLPSSPLLYPPAVTRALIPPPAGRPLLPTPFLSPSGSALGASRAGCCGA